MQVHVHVTTITLHKLCPNRLSVCEKALSDYLETKRLAFPRFYFISSADLLDILSKGNQPVEVGPAAYIHNVPCTNVLNTMYSLHL